jgi:hypothetical protein
VSNMQKNMNLRRHLKRVAGLFSPAVDAGWEAVEHRYGKFVWFDLKEIENETGVQNNRQHAKVARR